MQVLLKIVLSPFSVLYGIITLLRNKIFDWRIFRSVSFDDSTICVGNLNTGGTGKSPMIEYLIRILQKHYKNIATLSRGYGRKTKGFIMASEQTTASETGDEPQQFYRKFKNISVAVCENRITGVQNLLKSDPKPDVILLDDAFQHRRIKPGMNILLTEYDNLYVYDFMLPSGRLRENKYGAKRANVIILTKSPENLSESEKEMIKNRLSPRSYQRVLFSHLKYCNPVSLKNETEVFDLNAAIDTEILLFTGIANPKPLELFLSDKCKEIHVLSFRDHHDYSDADIEKISGEFCTIVSKKKAIFTTEKDFVRLMHHKNFSKLLSYPVYYVPVEMDFDDNDKIICEQIILDYARKN